MNIERVSPRQYQPASPRKVTFNPVVQVKTFTSSDPISATRPTLHASRLESALRTAAPRAKKVQVEQKPEKPPPRPPYVTPETPEKQKGRLLFWCAMGSLALIPAFGPGALVITGICAFVSAIYFIQHNRHINYERFYEDRTHFASTNRSLSEQPSSKAKTKDRQNSPTQHRQSANTYRESGTNPARNENRRAGTGTHRTYNHTSRHNHS